MFSSRTGWDLRPNRLAERVAARRASGVRLLDLTASNPTRAGIEHPADVLEPLAGAEARRYDPSPFGLPGARQAVASDFARRGYTVGPDEVLLTASTSEAYAFLFKLLADPGDEILVPRPGYPLFDFLAGLESVRTRGYALAYDGEWHLDLSALRAAVSERTRALVVVNPNNPTGVFLKRDERGALEELCAERSLALVSDEVFSDFAFGDDPRREASVASVQGALAFALGGLSKSCALPQLKLAWAAVAGPAALRRDALARLEVIADSYLSVSTPVQVAAPELLARRAELQAPIRVRTAANLRRLRARLPGSPATLLAPEGGWYAVLRVPATISEEERVLRLLEQRDLLVHPGYFFDFPREAYLVLSLLTPADDFAEGVERLLADLVL
ncbi:MAG TPA: pyridoxal phosphate-dependent aminotransferase [Vicinamibacteria bacterium]|nr:pyridoxal phosphate-dependent aminotransferase [Vicinamibacteria bacterium]